MHSVTQLLQLHVAASDLLTCADAGTDPLHLWACARGIFLPSTSANTALGTRGTCPATCTLHGGVFQPPTDNSLALKKHACTAVCWLPIINSIKSNEIISHLIN